MLHLRLGSRANTNSDGLLYSPAPEIFMAVTLNSYSIPATTSFTAHVLSGRNFRETISEQCSGVVKLNQSKIKKMQTFDEFIHGIDHGPEIAALLAFLQNIAQDTGPSFVTWGVP